MATALDHIKRSLRLIKAIAAGEEPTAAEGEDALVTLNRMLHGFPSMGIERNHTTLSGLTAELNMPEEELGCVEWMLAMDLAPEYEVDPPPRVVEMAESSKRYLQGVYVRVDDVAVDSGLLNMPSQGPSNWNINNG